MQWLKVLVVGVMAIVAVWLVWDSTRPLVYQLNVVNNSQQVVHRLRLLGDGVVTEQLVESIAPGHNVVLKATLNRRGDLRFEVHQGLNRVDSIIVADVNNIEHLQQQLTVGPGNRYIISAGH